MKALRKTKIIATLGPATDSADTIRGLIEAGANIFRLNMSHAPHDWSRDVVGRIRSASAECGKTVAILLGLQGPSIRTGDVDGKLKIDVDSIVEFRNEDLAPGQTLSVTTNYDGLSNDVEVGKVMLVDNGELHFKVIQQQPGRLVCEALTDGEMGSRRHINLPGVKVNLPPLTPKDLLDIKLAGELAVDFVAISFVRDAEHISYLRTKLAEVNCYARIVAKIEDQEAVRNLSEIITKSDAVMVARGDLGIEVNIEELPVVQRRILKECATIGRKVIVATHMLESMVENPVPTRAEITDVANAVFEQADAVMLSGETSVGKYPIKCIEVLDRITRRIEQEPSAGFCKNLMLYNDKHHCVKSAVALANSLDSKNTQIIIFTARGVLGNYTAHQRPVKAPIFAFSPDPKVVRALQMNRSVYPYRMDFENNPEETIAKATGFLKESGLVNPGDPCVILSDVLSSDIDTNAILLREA